MRWNRAGSRHQVFLKSSIASKLASALAPGGCHTTSSKLNSSRSEEHTSELQSRFDLVCRLLLAKKKTADNRNSCVRDPPPPTICYSLFFFSASATTDIYTLSLHDALPIYPSTGRVCAGTARVPGTRYS